mgnify:CR=1 FL=1
MTNQIFLIGRLTYDPEVTLLENDKEKSLITVAVTRNYKNENGEYDTDFVDCILWDGVAKNTSEYCKKGDLISIKGRLQTSNYESKDGKNIKMTQVVAEKISFLSSNKLINQYN